MSGPLSSRSGPDLRIVGVVCGIAAAIFLTNLFLGRAALPFFADTGDAMRMVMVRDFLAGQGWYDLTVHRLNTPWGAEIHWSRLVDVPLALLVAAFTPLLGDANALLVAGTIWPMFLLAVLLWLSAKLAFRLVGPQGVLPALILPILSPAITAEFTPGVPQCFKGPYGNLDPWLQANWIAAIVEAKPWLSNLAEMPAYAVAVGVPVLLAVVIVCLRLWRVRQDRAEWAVLLVFLVAMSLVMLAQVRGARLAIMLAMPAAAWLIVSARQRYLAKASAANIIGLLVGWLAFAGVVLALAVTGIQNLLPSDAAQVAEQRSNAQACLVPGAFTDLALMPPKRIMAPIDLGAHVLLYTSHSVVAAPYHRNQQGVLDTFRFFNEPIGTARMNLAERGIDLVVICPGMPEVSGFPDQAPDSFAALFASNTLPLWLEDVSVPGSPLRIYMVTP